MWDAAKKIVDPTYKKSSKSVPLKAANQVVAPEPVVEVPVYTAEEVDEIVEKHEGTMWSPEDAERMEQLIRGMTDWINKNEAFLDNPKEFLPDVFHGEVEEVTHQTEVDIDLDDMKVPVDVAGLTPVYEVPKDSWMGNDEVQGSVFSITIDYSNVS